jgi:hypothetical protein
VLWDRPGRVAGSRDEVAGHVGVGRTGWVVGVHEVRGGADVAEYALRMIGLTLEEGKHLLAAVQVHFVQT